MTSDQYRAALTTLGLSQQAAGRWLGVSPKTAHNYATKGPSGSAARAVGLAVRLRGLDDDRWCYDIDGMLPDLDGFWVRYADLIAALELPGSVSE